MPILPFILTLFFLGIFINESNAGKHGKKKGAPIITEQPEKHSRVGTAVKYKKGEVTIITTEPGETSRILEQGIDENRSEKDEEILEAPIKQATSRSANGNSQCCSNETKKQTSTAFGLCLHGANAAAIYATTGLAYPKAFKILIAFASSLVSTLANCSLSCRKGDSGCKHSNFLTPVIACGCSFLPTAAASLYFTGSISHFANLGPYAASCLCNTCCFQAMPHLTTPPGDCTATCCEAGVFPDFRTVRDIRKAKYLPDEEYPKGCCKCMRFFYECCEYGCYASD